jgi:antitoxin PrlF
MITSKLTSKAQTTIPRAVRRHLGLQEGDFLGFVIEGSRVLLCKPANAAPSPPPVGRKLFAEWESEVDRRAYDGL